MTLHIPQPEKLYCVRPRSVLTADEKGASRGHTCFIRLIGDKAASAFDPQTDPGKRSLNALNSDYGYAPFLIQNISVSFEEKLQVLQTFGDSSVAYYFGNSPVKYMFSGLTVDDVDNVQFIDFMTAYAEFMRGTRLAQAYCLLEIVTPSAKIIGSFTNVNFSQDSTRDTDVQFSFGFLAKMVIPLQPIDDGSAVDPTDYNYQLNFGQGSYESLATDAQTFYNQARVLNIQQNANGPTPEGTYSGSSFGTGISSPGGPWAAAIQKFTSQADAFIDSIFQPVYGLLSKVLEFLNTLSGNIMDILKGFTNPVKSVLRKVRNLSSQVKSVVNQIKNFGLISGIKNEISSVQSDFKKTVESLKDTFGSISRLPSTMAENMKQQYGKGLFDPNRLTMGSSTSGAAFKMKLMKQVRPENDSVLTSGSITPVVKSYSLDTPLPPPLPGRVYKLGV